MQLTNFTEFGLRALMRMASAPGRTFSSADIADEFHISRAHLSKVMSALAAGGYIVTRRGSGGGATLARPAERISIGAVVRRLEKGDGIAECFRADGGNCVCRPECRLRDMFAAAEEAFLRELDRRSLSECALAPRAAWTHPRAEKTRPEA